MIRIFLAVVFSLLILINTGSPVLAGNELRQAQAYTSLCEAGGCTKEDFYPVINPATGQVIQDVLLFSPASGACMDFIVPQDTEADVWINTISPDGTVKTDSGTAFAVQNVCLAFISWVANPIDMMPNPCMVGPCGTAQMMESGIRLPINGIEAVPPGLVLVAWMDGQIVILREGSTIIGEWPANWLLFYTTI